MRKRFGGVILDISTRLILPFTMMYSIYILAAGEESPGGGFQAGAVLALGFIFGRLIKGENSFTLRLTGPIAVAIAGVGAFFYVLTGWLSLLNGGYFLEYAMMPFAFMGYERLHALGIFLIEVGVTVCVMMTITTIMEALLRREDFE